MLLSRKPSGCFFSLVGLGFRIGQVQSLHLTSYNAVIKYARNENCYFKKIYSDDLNFTQLEPLIKSKKIVEDQSIVSFNNVVNMVEMTNNNLIPFFKQFTEKLKEKDVDRLIYILNRLREIKFKSMSTSLHYLLSFVDQALSEHLNEQKIITNEDFRFFFQIVLMFDEIGLQSWSQFIRRLAVKSLDNFHLFENKENLLRAMYVMNLSRKQISNEKAMLIELQVMKYFYHNELNLKEIGLICMSFHKTQTKFHTSLMERITEKLIDEIDHVEETIDPLCVSSILKGIYSSEHKLDPSLLDKLGKKLLSTDKFSEKFLVLTKFLAILKKYRIYNESIIDACLESFAVQETIRIKELSRLLLNLLFFDVQLNAKQIGKFNEQFEKIKSNYAIYRVEYLLSVYALASHGLILKEEIFNIYDREFIRILKNKYSDTYYFFINLNNILKLFGNSNYKEIAFKDNELLKIFNSFESLGKSDVYARFKKFERYASKLYLSYQVLKDSLEGRVHLIHLMPGCKYPQIVITPKKSLLKDYPFEVAPNVAFGLSVVRIPGPEIYCDTKSQRLSGFYTMENNLLKKMGFQLFELESNLISHTTSELKLYLTEKVLEHLKDSNNVERSKETKY